jgi:hypothetical protein
MNARSIVTLGAVGAALALGTPVAQARSSHTASLTFTGNVRTNALPAHYEWAGSIEGTIDGGMTSTIVSLDPVPGPEWPIIVDWRVSSGHQIVHRTHKRDI